MVGFTFFTSVSLAAKVLSESWRLDKLRKAGILKHHMQKAASWITKRCCPLQRWFQSLHGSSTIIHILVYVRLLYYDRRAKFVQETSVSYNIHKKLHKNEHITVNDTKMNEFNQYIHIASTLLIVAYIPQSTLNLYGSSVLEIDGSKYRRSTSYVHTTL